MNTQAASRPETAASDLGRPFAEPLAETVPAWDDGPAPGPPEVGGLQRDGLVLLVGTALVGIANYGFVLALVWILPSHQFSELASINSILLVLITVANAALPWVVARAVVRSTPGSPMRRQALTVTIAVSLACAGAGFLILLALSASYASPALEACAALIVVLAFLVQAGSGYLQGRRLFATLGILMVVEAAIKVGVGSLLAIAVGAVRGPDRCGHRDRTRRCGEPVVGQTLTSAVPACRCGPIPGGRSAAWGRSRPGCRRWPCSM